LTQQIQSQPAAIDLRGLQRSVSGAMLRDRHRLRSALSRIIDAHRKGRSVDAEALKLAQQIAGSAERAQQRRARLPAIAYPAQLPVSERKDEIAAAIAAHPVVIVAGETGSGKTTQLPKICLELGRGVVGMIAHTQRARSQGGSLRSSARRWARTSATVFASAIASARAITCAS
jgi:ATP-dependent helicase HrpA